MRLWLALQVKVMATPTHGGAAACMVLVANYSNTPMAAPYFVLLAGYVRAWFRVSVPDKPSCCCPERINTQTDGPNYLRMDFLHHLMCCYATFELFALYASRCPPVERQFQAFEELLNGTDWLDFSGVNPSSSDSVHNGPHAARVRCERPDACVAERESL